MCENVNPKVIVDDDFLDLRNVHSKPFSRRPISSHSVTRESSSINTQGKTSTVKEVLPGLQKFLNTYNKKRSNSFPYKNNSRENPRQVDSRFRRKVEIKTLTSRSEIILQENEEGRKETISSDVSSRSRSSEIGKGNDDPVQTILPEPTQKVKKRSRIRTEYESSQTDIPLKAEEENDACIKIKRQKSNIKLKTTENQSEKKSEVLINHVQFDVRKKKESEKNAFEATLNPKGSDNYKQDQFDWTNSKLESPCPMYTIPTFKKCWTVPSLPLIKNTFSWTKHYNALCTKVDRKTYEFDTDDTVSDSEDQQSDYSSISRNNYMNLIFCLGCLCGIFLIGGILTASEIHADYFKPLESQDGLFAFFGEEVSNTFRLILSVLQQILTLPSTILFGTSEKPTSHWSIFTKYVYFIPE